MYKKLKLTTVAVGAACTVCMVAGIANADQIIPSPQVPRTSPSPQATQPQTPPDAATPGVASLPQAPPATVWRQTPDDGDGTGADNGGTNNGGGYRVSPKAPPRKAPVKPKPGTWEQVPLPKTPPDVLGSGASSIPRPAFVPRDVAQWANGWLDYGNSVADGAYTAAGLPPDQASRHAAGTVTGAAAGALIGGATGAVVVGGPAAVGGALIGGTIGGIAGAALGTFVPAPVVGTVTSGVAGTALGAGIGAAAGGAVGAALGGIAGATVGGAVGGITGAALSGGPGNPHMPTNPLPPLPAPAPAPAAPAAPPAPKPAPVPMPGPAHFDVNAAIDGVAAWAQQQAHDAVGALAGLLPHPPA